MFQFEYLISFWHFHNTCLYECLHSCVILFIIIVISIVYMCFNPKFHSDMQCKIFCVKVMSSFDSIYSVRLFLLIMLIVYLYNFPQSYIFGIISYHKLCVRPIFCTRVFHFEHNSLT